MGAVTALFRQPEAAPEPTPRLTAWARWSLLRHPRLPGVLVALAASTVAGLVADWWTPRGPVTSGQALAAMAIGLTVGLVSGAAMRSRWAMLLAPAVFVLVFELGRVDAVGPSVDAVDLSSFHGLAAFAVGRLFHAVLVVLPMLLGVALGRAWALRGTVGTPPSRRARVGRAVRRTAVLVTAVALLLLAVGMLRPGATAPIVTTDGEPVAGSVAELTKVEVNGHDQWLMIRGNSADNPVLLFLAGGPGGFEIGTMASEAKPLEQDFVVVTWEQRGTGKSYASFDPGESLTFDGAVADTLEVTEYLRDRFGVDEVFLVGNSYGTLLGVRAVQDRPELYAAFVGTGQMVSIRETDQMFYEDTLDYAERTGDQALVDELRQNGEPPYDDPADYTATVNGERQWNDYSDITGFPGLREPLDYLGAEEYSLVDKVRSLTGLVDTHALMYPGLQDIDLRADAPRLSVPVYLVQGAHEARGRAVLAAEWFEQLQAPRKEWFTFEVSGHRPFAQEPERFREVMDDVLADAGVTPVAVDDVSATAADEDLLVLFSRYNPAVWPGHVVAYLLGMLVLALVRFRPGRTTDGIVAGFLAATWLWLGVVFHGIYAAQVAAVLSAVYATLFVVQAGLFARAAAVRSLRFGRGSGLSGWVGWGSLAYALVLYPALAVALGHGWPEIPLLGMAPCPSAIATFGLLLLARPPVPRHLLAIPLVWAVMAPLAAVGRGVYEDIGLFVVGVVAVAVILHRDGSRTRKRAARSAADPGAATRVAPAAGPAGQRSR
ncbi:MAG TPA: DUF6064 family protein [Nocardioidaceae bacterium]|nr:DUF6064 family protein [Nocardioidaceae bacterium]